MKKKKKRIPNTTGKYECQLILPMLLKLRRADGRIGLRWFNQVTRAIFLTGKKIHWKLLSPPRGAGSWLFVPQTDFLLLRVMTDLHCSLRQNKGGKLLLTVQSNSVFLALCFLRKNRTGRCLRQFWRILKTTVFNRCSWRHGCPARTVALRLLDSSRKKPAAFYRSLKSQLRCHCEGGWPCL